MCIMRLHRHIEGVALIGPASAPEVEPDVVGCEGCCPFTFLSAAQS